MIGRAVTGGALLCGAGTIIEGGKAMRL